MAGQEPERNGGKKYSTSVFVAASSRSSCNFPDQLTTLRWCHVGRDNFNIKGSGSKETVRRLKTFQTLHMQKDVSSPLISHFAVKE